MKFTIVQEDTASRDAVKRTRKQLAKQEQQMHARSLVRHGVNCDIFECPTIYGKICFKAEPDRIVE